MLNRAPKKFFFDTEFHEHNVKTADGRTVRMVELISIGVVDDQGRTFHMVNSEFDREAAEKNHFLKTNVLDKLPPESEWKPMDEISNALLRFVGSSDAEFHYWEAPHDPFLLYQLLAPKMYRDSRPAMLNMRENIKGAFNLRQTFNDLGQPKGIMPPKPANQHNPLDDAQWDKAAWQAMDDYKSKLLAATKPRGFEVG